MNHRIGRAVFAVVIGLLVATLSYRWITNPEGRQERARQEAVVHVARGFLRSATGLEVLEIVDPLAPNRKAGKVYIYPEGDGWAVSGHYRRDENDRWHPWLMSLDANLKLRSLKLQDRQLLERAAKDPRLDASL